MDGKESICIVDFNGHDEHWLPTAFWADWFIEEKEVTFGGEWCDIPDMPSNVEPSEDDVYNWVNRHSGPLAAGSSIICL